MKRIVSCVVLQVALAAAAPALELPPGGEDLAGGAPLRAWVPAGQGAVEDLPGGGKAVAVARPDPQKPYAAQFALDCPAAELKPGDRVFIVVRARVADAESGALSLKLQHNRSPWHEAAPSTDFPVYAGWREYPVLLQVRDAVPQGEAQLVLFCGQRAQRIEVSDIRVLKYPADADPAAFPRIARTYPGREPDAPWRKAALERIERERKADLAVVVRDEAGQPLRDAEVRLTLRRHAFGFGSAIPMRWLLDEGENGRHMREIADRCFSEIVFENDLKDGFWGPDVSPERAARRNADFDRAFAWLAERHIAVRGHYLMQVARPPNLHGMKDAAAIREHFLSATRARLAFVGDRVVEWDVINHPVAWSGADLLSRVPGLEHLDREVFELARSLTKLPLLVNEDQLFRPGRQGDDTFAYVQALQRDGFRVDGIGNQAHLHESFLPSPREVLKGSEHFASIVPRLVVTEFDVVTTDDEELAADYTRDLVIACFSHPAYSGFLWWGFWEGAHWKPEAASWNRDWTPRKRAAVFDEWIAGRWRTEVTVRTDAEGTARWRGFPGWYEAQAGAEALPLVHAQAPRPAVFRLNRPACP